jgi:hypothetical protein
MGKDKRMDKLVGGRRVEDKFKWSVQIDLGGTNAVGKATDNFVTISGTAKDATEAALAAQKARQAFLDAENATKQVDADKAVAPRSDVAKGGPLLKGTTVR